jgi:hypothetical protein
MTPNDGQKTKSISKTDAQNGGSDTSASASASPATQIAVSMDHFDPYRMQTTPPISHEGTGYAQLPDSSNINDSTGTLFFQ